MHQVTAYAKLTSSWSKSPLAIASVEGDVRCVLFAVRSGGDKVNACFYFSNFPMLQTQNKVAGDGDLVPNTPCPIRPLFSRRLAHVTSRQ